MSPRAAKAAGLAAVLVAILARVLWLAGKPFWRDEAWVAALAFQPFNLSTPGPVRAVPVGFLLITKLMGLLPLRPEVSLRLVPLTAGVAAILCLALLARRLGAGRAGAATTLWLGAGIQGFIYYSRELKPYSLDLLFASLVPLLVLDTLGSRVPPRRRLGHWLALALATSLSPWLSFGSVFSVTATFAAATLLFWRRARPDARRAWTGVVAFWVLSFALLFASALASQAGNARMIDEWADDMAFVTQAPLLLRPWVAAFAYARTPLDYLFPGLALVALGLIALGVAAGSRASRRVLGALVALTALEVIAAVLVHRYVLTQGRLLLFAAPAYVIFAALGLQAAARLASRRHGAALGVALAAIAATASAAQAVRHRLPPYVDDPALYFRFDILHDIDPIIEAASQLARPDEPVFVSRYSGEMFRYYHRNRLPGATVCTRFNCRNEGPAVIAWLAGVERRGYMILLDSDDSRGRREIVAAAGCEAESVAQARGVRLWRITRRRPAL